MDDQEASVNESSLQRYDAEPHAVTLKMIESDLLAVESILLLEQLKSRS
jgi:hypothetical protein